MTDSTNPRVMADNIKELFGKAIDQGAEIKALGTYSTDEVKTGKKFKNLDVYSRIYELTEPVSIVAGVWTDLLSSFSGDKLINFIGYGENTTSIIGVASRIYTNKLQAAALRSNVDCYSFYVEYTKASPSPNLILAPNPDTRTLEEPEVRDPEAELDPIEEIE